MFRNKKAHGGPLDIIHHFVAIGVAVVLLRMALDPSLLNPMLVLIIAIVFIIMEIAGLLM